MRVKICGLTSVADATEVARCGADFAGLVLAPSPRHVPLESAAQIAAALPAAIQPVLVFRDATREEVLGALSVTGCNWLQLHGRESVSYLSEIRQRRPQVRFIRAWELRRHKRPTNCWTICGRRTPRACGSTSCCWTHPRAAPIRALSASATSRCAARRGHPKSGARAG